MRRLGRCGLAALRAALGCLALAAWPTEPSAGRDEYEVKAAFLLNFARLVEWPAGAPQPPASGALVIGVAGPAEVLAVIEQNLAHASLGGRSVEVREIGGAAGVPGAHLVFVTRDAEAQARALIEAARANGAVCVGEIAGLAARGCTINFFTEAQKLRFEINQAAARRAGLRLSSRLLQLAKLVEDAS